MLSRLAVICLAIVLFGCRPRAEHPGVLVVAMDQDIITIDPHQHDDSVTHSVLSNVYDALVAFDKDMQVVPGLAESWSNPTDLTWRFKLREGVTFHDGRPVTARDVKYSLERALRLKSAHYLLAIRGIDVVSPSALELHTEVPHPVLLNKLAVVGIVPQDTPASMGKAIGTGPYRVVEYAPGKALSLAANEVYWGGAPPIKKAMFKVIPGPVERAKALARGEVHLVREVPRREVADAGEGVRYLSYPGLAVVVLGVNFKVEGPLRSREVREAIYWAVDSEALIRQSGVEAAPVDQIVPPTVFGFLPGRDAGRPRLEKARELMRKAGYEKGFDVTLDMPASSAGTVGPVVAEQLSRIGIRVKVESLDWPDFSARLNNAGSRFFSVGWACYGDASDIFDAVLHTPDGASYGASNFGAYSNPELDRAIERAATILQPSLRLEALQEAMRISMEDLPLIPLYNRMRSYGVDNRVRFQPRQNGQVILREISWSDSKSR